MNTKSNTVGIQHTVDIQHIIGIQHTVGMQHIIGMQHTVDMQHTVGIHYSDEFERARAVKIPSRAELGLFNFQAETELDFF